MTIKIGKPALVAAAAAGKGLFVLGVAGVAYCGLTAVGMTADTINHADLARRIVELTQPLTSNILNAVDFKLRADVPATVRMGVASFVALPAVLGAALAGNKLGEAASGALGERTAVSSAGKVPGAINGFAARLRGIASGVIAAGENSRNHYDNPSEPEAEAEAMR